MQPTGIKITVIAVTLEIVGAAGVLEEEREYFDLGIIGAVRHLALLLPIVALAEEAEAKAAAQAAQLSGKPG